MGLEAARHLVSRYPNVLILMIIADPPLQLETEARKAGIRGVCAKSRLPHLFLAIEAVVTAPRFPYAPVLGLAAGAMEFIPVVGPLVAAVAIVFIGFLTTYPHLWAMIVFFAIWRVVQDYVVSPRVMGGTLELHPLAAIAAVLMGGELGGVLGVYLSIPVAAAVRIVWVSWRKYSSAIAAAPAAPADGVHGIARRTNAIGPRP